MATSFKREPKMKTTETSVDEVGKGMKKGGHAHKKHMAMGGALPVNPAMARRPMARPVMANSMARPMAANPMMRKKGGEVESKSEHKAEMREMHKIEKELKHHENEKASKAHHGLKRGGMAKTVPGGLLGGLEATRPDSKRKTGDIEGPGYKRGGKIMHKAKGGNVSNYAETKVVGAKQVKGFNTKTGGLEGKGYAKGGSVKPYENTKVVGGPKMPTKKLGTKGIKQSPAGYAEGGHVRMHELTHEVGGHHKIDHHPMKKGGKCAW